MLALSWDHASTAKSADTAPDARLFTLYLRARTDSELSSSMEISSARLSPEAYRIGKAEPAALAAHFGRTTGQTPNSTLQIFPNPSSGAFFVKNPFSAERSSVYIWDLNGRLVWEKEGDLPAQIAVNSPNFFSPGLYLVELKSAGQTLRGKVVVN